jgi:hypothetical protein
MSILVLYSIIKTILRIDMKQHLSPTESHQTGTCLINTKTEFFLGQTGFALAFLPIGLIELTLWNAGTENL